MVSSPGRPLPSRVSESINLALSNAAGRAGHILEDDSHASSLWRHIKSTHVSAYDFKCEVVIARAALVERTKFGPICDWSIRDSEMVKVDRLPATVDKFMMILYPGVLWCNPRLGRLHSI